MTGAQGELHWSELVSPDPEKAAAFFEAAFGWSFRIVEAEGGRSRHVAVLDDAPVTSVVAPFGDGGPEGQAQWLTYVAVNDIDATVKDVPKLGGEVLRPPFHAPGLGRVAIIQDPGGAVLAMVTPEG